MFLSLCGSLNCVDIMFKLSFFCFSEENLLAWTLPSVCVILLWTEGGCGFQVILRALPCQACCFVKVNRTAQEKIMKTVLEMTYHSVKQNQKPRAAVSVVVWSLPTGKCSSPVTAQSGRGLQLSLPSSVPASKAGMLNAGWLGEALERCLEGSTLPAVATQSLPGT